MKLLTFRLPYRTFWAHMPHVFTLIGESWDFCKKQQAIMHVGFWFIFLPALASGLLMDFEAGHKSLFQAQQELILPLALTYLAISLVITWGTVCILTIGKRLLQAKAGRTRSSFRAVRQQAGQFFIPYLLTGILRGIITLFWTLLLIIPGIIYFVRTIFMPVIVVCEGIGYRPALRRSAEIVKGQFWQVLWTVFLTSLCVMAPPQILTSVFTYMSEGAPFPIVLAANVASGILVSIGLIVYVLCLIQIYGYFKPKGHSHN